MDATTETEPQWDRLEKVLQAATDAKASEFDMIEWWHKPEGSCKTVGCAIGHFCHRHPRAALKVKVGTRGETWIHLDRTGQSSFSAIEGYFGITYQQAVELFAPGSYLSGDKGYGGIFVKRQVLRRLRAFIDSRGTVMA